MRKDTLGLSERLLESAETWLALNVHHEARGESYQCQVMVAEVTLRRVASSYYPDTVEGVVMQPSQFSWTLEREPDFSVITQEDRNVARQALKGLFYTTTELHYARYEIDNYWTNKMTPTIQCGAHIFYDNGGKP
ncbi:Hydrolase_2 domain-containing protein [Vibrio phage 15E36.1]|uniref:Hydrolase_2 domain-containing protein n=1 Tax=Vibrio phage 15E36.1 TaxID=2859290 RepID=A0AAE7XVI4_9CAUD|nr:Hydrolase_2 domain-containing protein [Vibrio phage 15E36.1]